VPKKENLRPPSIAYFRVILGFQQCCTGFGITMMPQPADTRLFRARSGANTGKNEINRPSRFPIVDGWPTQLNGTVNGFSLHINMRSKTA